MVGILFVLLLLVPIAELYVIVQVSDVIGLVATLVLLLVVSIAGTYLLRQQGTATWERTREALQRGEMPTKEATDGFMILLGGALLLTPGFLTDIVGLALLFPASRAVIKKFFRSVVFAKLARRHPAGAAGVYTVEVIRRRRRNAGDQNEAKDSRPGLSSEAPPREEPGADGGDSRDST